MSPSTSPSSLSRSTSSPACKITSPPEGWPDGTSAGFDTNLHHGLDSDWKLHVRPVGKVRAIMVFVDFPNAPAEDNEMPYDDVDAYHDFLEPGVDLSDLDGPAPGAI